MLIRLKKITKNRCTSCNIEKSENDFDLRKGSRKCRECENKYRKEWKKAKRQKQIVQCTSCGNSKERKDFPLKSLNNPVRICYNCLSVDLDKGQTYFDLNDELFLEGKRFCYSCNQIKSIEYFVKRPNKKHGRGSVCNQCIKPKDRQNRLKSTYGLTMKELNDLYIEQNGQCKICNSSLILENSTIENRNMRACIDHCHESNLIRGLLCSNCNRAIGLFKDRIDLLLSAAKYLKLGHLKSRELLENLEADNQQPS